jgi:rubrerythrin
MQSSRRNHRAKRSHSADQMRTYAAAAVAAERRDAERYRRLRDPNNGTALWVINNCGLTDAAELYAVIDAAMAKGKT